MKKLIKLFVICLLAIVSFSGCGKETSKAKYTIISTSYPGYDFVRAIIKDVDDVEVKMLLKPGSESHDYEPTPQDIIDIQNANIFIYVGGDSDNWIDGILKDIDTSKTKIIKLIDLVETIDEEDLPGLEESNDDKEIDEHVWTNPRNAIDILEKLRDEIMLMDNSNMGKYVVNCDNYMNKIKKIDIEIRELVKNAKRKEIIFGDRFPILYFAKEYELDYYAAFPGCSEQSEASAKTISFLIDKVKEDNIPVVFHIELSNKSIALAIADETGAKVREYHTAHNISQKDFDDGVTYVDIMNKNIEVLKEALN